jgi:signal transduction histidine kinase
VAAPVPPGPPSFELWALFEAGPGLGAPGARYVLAKRVEPQDRNVGRSTWRVAALGPLVTPLGDLVIDGAGSLIAVTEDGAIHLSTDGTAWSPVPRIEFLPGPLSGGFVDLHGYLWFRAGSAALFRFDGAGRRWERYWHGLGLPSNNVFCVLEASDGKVWAGTKDGVYAFPAGDPGDPAIWHKAGDVSLEAVTGLAEDRAGRIWISSSEAFPGAFYFQDGAWHRSQQSERPGSGSGIADVPIRRIVADRSGDLWFFPSARLAAGADEEGKRPGYRIFRYSVNPYGPSRFWSMEIPCGPASDLLLAQDKSLWIATDEGLLRTNAAGGGARIYAEGQGLRSSRIWAIAEAADEAIWVCYDPSTASGVTRLKDGEPARTFDERDGLTSPNARSIACTISSGGSDVWVATDRGILRFDGECWYGYSVASLRRQESEVWTLAVAGTRRPGGASEGESILAGVIGHGIYRLRLDDRRRPRITLMDLDLAADGAVTFRWDGRDFKNETPPIYLRFRTRIDGGTWSRFTADKTVSIPGLSPGNHTFSVEVRDLDGNSNRDEATMPFAVPARISTFFSPVLLAALGGAGAAMALAALAAGLAWRSLRRTGGGRAADPARVFAAFPGAVLLLDGEGKIAGISGRQPEALGLPRGATAGELIGCPPEVFPVFQNDTGRGVLRRAMAGEAAAIEAAPMTPGRFADLMAFPLGDGGEGGRSARPAVVLVEEVTASRRAMETRERTRRLLALQDLAGRVVSELKDATAGGRASELFEDLRRFAEGPQGDVPRESLELAALLEGLLGSKDGGGGSVRLPKGVEAGVSAQTGLWPVSGETASVRRAFEEILRNAGDAMEEGGRLSVRLRNRRIDSGDPGDLRPGSYVEVEVGDTGPGIVPAEAGRAFDPFYSTKPRDRARGLGLSVAYGIVRRLGGDVRIASMPGAGTTVTVLLPAVP